MTQNQLDFLAESAIRGVKTINNKQIDISVAYAAMETFLKAYKRRNLEPYHGEISLAVLQRALNAYAIAKEPDNLFTEDRATAYFKRLDKETAQSVTFADYVSSVCQTVYAKMFNLI